MVHFYSKKCIFRWGLKRAPPPRYTSVEKYAGTDRVKALATLLIVCKIQILKYALNLTINIEVSDFFPFWGGVNFALASPLTPLESVSRSEVAKITRG